MDKALLLVESSDASTAGRLERVLALLGVNSSRSTAAAALAFINAATDGSKFRQLGTATEFLKLAETLDGNPEARLNWQKNVHSALVFAANDSSSFETLARKITGNVKARLDKADRSTGWTVSSGYPEFCQSMSGVQVAAGSDAESVLVLDAIKPGANIITNSNCSALTRLEFHGVPVFLSTAGVIDVDAPLPARIFDIRTHFLAATPVAMYTKWAFSETCWQPPETTACLVIDDPLLRPRYGYLKYQHLLGLMERFNFSTSIAFIPWNWKRSSRQIVRLFQENPKRFSLSIHGCDHIGGEFGSRNHGRLAWKSRQATQRMAGHQSRTGLAHDPVMVFPQGVFSEAAMAVLKRGDFIGVVNSDVISTDPQPTTIKIADYWNVAVMNYSDFPIFTRRYPWAGVENFAFDILLGKPCIVVVHHNDCHDGCRHVVEFMERLNKLNARLRWTNLAEVTRRSFRQRELSPEITEVEIFGNEVRLENNSNAEKTFRCRKQESDPAAIKDIRAAPQPVNWSPRDGHVYFDVKLQPGRTQTVAITYAEPADTAFAGENLKYRLKAMVRRYLCEFRDNYMMRKSFSQ
jgi:hypothetical protein